MSRPRDTFPWRALDGILLLDKPVGPSSNQALQHARRLFRAEKGGHTGSLDPLASGMLPLCFGEATKIAGLLLSGRKAYETVAQFGVETESGDADGRVIAQRPVPALDEHSVREALLPLTGRIRQIPPIYSALKQDGEPLYAKARRGEAVAVQAREVDVESIELLELQGDRARLHIVCGAGTYIRSLVRDLGAALGCGAHVAQLRRLWAEPFHGVPMHTPAQLEALAAQGEAQLLASLLPLDAGLAHLPRVDLDAGQAFRLGQGQRLPWAGAAADAGEWAAFGPDGRVLGLVRREPDGLLKPERLFRHAVQAALGPPRQR